MLPERALPHYLLKLFLKHLLISLDFLAKVIHTGTSTEYLHLLFIEALIRGSSLKKVHRYPRQQYTARDEQRNCQTGFGEV